MKNKPKNNYCLCYGVKEKNNKPACFSEEFN